MLGCVDVAFAWRHRIRAGWMKRNEAVAIVGLGCRLPGDVTSPEELWRLLMAGGDAVGPFPDDRGWDVAGACTARLDAPGHHVQREGGFVAADRFDAQFFGISSREAIAMDPQQRLLLETAWETLERSGIDPSSLRGSRTGVYIGAMASEYGPRLDEGSAFEGHVLTGTTGSVNSGRISYVLGLEGPSITVDTACSASLVALHLAVRALRSGECDFALVGGASTAPTLGMFIEFSRLRALSRDGRCKAFSADADGFGISEGVSMLALERLSDARRGGRQVLAVVRGSAINQDGPSKRLSAPSAPAQQKVILQALADAGLTSHEVDAVEAHGTGTKLGDWIEARALMATYGKAHQEGRPLLVGSLKSNIGHTQAASGVAGVIKMVLALRHGTLPRTLHVQTPAPFLDGESAGLKVLTEQQRWPEPTVPRPLRAGVSAFGISGTNAHVIIEQAPRTPRTADMGQQQAPATHRELAVVVSARSAPGLADQTARLASHIEADPTLDLAAVAGALVRSRALWDHRAVVIGTDRAQLIAGLREVAEGQPSSSGRVGVAVPGDVAKSVWVFPGQGAQWTGMGLRLWDTEPVFAARMAQCEAALGPWVDWSLSEVIRSPVAGTLERVDVVQPASFAVMVSLAEVWRSWGVRPDAVLGHSQGEIAAACVAGALSLRDAARIVALRSQAIARSLVGRGAMLSVAIGEDQAVTDARRWNGSVEIAAVNGPRAVTLAGPPAELCEAQAFYQGQDVRTRMIPVDYASHTNQVEDVREELAKVLCAVAPTAAAVPFFSTVEGRWLDGGELDADYWFRNLREPVKFARAVRELGGQGFGAFLEVSSHPVLTASTQETLEESAVTTAVTVGTLRRGDGGRCRLLKSAAELFVRGLPVDWAAALPSGPAPVTLPTTAFQQKRFWLTSGTGGSGDVTRAGLLPAEHPLLGALLEDPGTGGLTLTGRISRSSHPWLVDHAVSGVVVVPGAVLVELALQAGERTGCQVVEELVLEAPLPIPESVAVRLQVVVGGEEESGRRTVVVYARPEDGQAAWTRHAGGRLAPGPECPGPQSAVGEVAWPPHGAVRLPPTRDVYRELAERGYEYGPAFQGLQAVWTRGDEIFAEVTLPEGVEPEGFVVHPALSDAALHAHGLSGAPMGPDGPADTALPFSWSGVEVQALGARAARVRISPAEDGDGICVLLTDAMGAPVLSVRSLTFRNIDRERLGRLGAASGADGPESMLALEWVPLSAAAPQTGEPGEPGMASPVTDAADLAAMATRCSGDVPRRLVWDAGTRGVERYGPALLERVREVTGEALRVVRGFLSDRVWAESRLLVVTRRGVAVRDDEAADVDPVAAAVWGLVRTAQNEHPGRIAITDTDMDTDMDTDVDVLPAARAADGIAAQAVRTAAQADEWQTAVRGSRVFVPRLTAGAGGLQPPRGLLPWTLAVTGSGTVEGVEMRPAPELLDPLGPGEIRIEVRSAGINFRDVLTTLGMLAHLSELGHEAAGVVTAVGSQVRDAKPGDRVWGLFPRAIGSLAVTDVRLVAQVPQDWSFEDAASVPVVFVTALYGLTDLAGLRPGERILVHAGTGGVGMAAIKLARRLGAEVFATASAGKHPVLRDMGLDEAHIADSRTLDFEEQFLAATEGAGMDVVLNSLTDGFVDASLRLLGPGGRFLEMGMRDIREAAEVARSHPGLTYLTCHFFDAGPDRVAQMLQELIGLFASGALTLPPVRVWDVRRAPEAFRTMAQGLHIGKNVVRMVRPLDPTGTVLVTGGTGRLGQLTAHRVVVEHGVRSVLLASRRGMEAEDAPQMCARLRELGARVKVVACDVADRAQVAQLLDQVPEDAPLTGVFHAAGVLDDGVVTALDAERLDRVLRPKADAAVHLDELTRGTDLAAFVLFSSLSGVLGTTGQANYAAANTFLDALAVRRRATGRAGQSLAWGLWAETSAMTGHLAGPDTARLARWGVRAMTSDAGMRLLDQALCSGRAVLVPAGLDVAAVRQRARYETVPSVLRQLAGRVRRTAHPVSAGQGIVSQLAGLEPSDRLAVLTELVRGEAGAVLGGDAVGANRAFRDAGIDSLTAVELRNRLSATTGVGLPATVVFDHPNPGALARHLSARLLGAEDRGTQNPARTRHRDRSFAVSPERADTSAQESASRSSGSSSSSSSAGLVADMGIDELIREAISDPQRRTEGS